MLKAEDPDPIKRWRSLSDWYAEFAAAPNWNYLSPMVGLTAWVEEQSFAVPLFFNTSMGELCVSLHDGYEPELPFFSCGVHADGQFRFELWAAVGRSRGRRLCPLEESRQTFLEYVALLRGMNDSPRTT